MLKVLIFLLGALGVADVVAKDGGQDLRRSMATPSLICSTCQEDDPPSGGGSEVVPSVSMVQGEIRSQSEHTFELELSNGVYFVVDDALNKMFIANSVGIQEMDLDAALLQWAGNNHARASALRQKLHATLTDPAREMLLVADRSQQNGLTSLWAPGSSKRQNSSGQGLMAGPGGAYQCWYDYFCYWQPISDFSSIGWGGYGFGFLAEGGGGNYGTPDWNYWNRWRQDRCDDAKINVRNMGIAAVTVAASCPAAETIAPIALCGAAAATLFSELDDWADNSVACKSSYPGPGNW